MNGTSRVKDRHLRRAVRGVLGFLTGSGRVLTGAEYVTVPVGGTLPSGRIAGSRTVLPASYVAGARATSPDDLYRLVYGDLAVTSPRAAYGNADAARLAPADRCFFPTSLGPAAGDRADAA